ncbi:MAG TPA: TetR/AcrR family transcriptional regulator [Ilumatobacter sp.]|nr:TetR/AcrR family transcriptional regulator [Ilumatobacter sp.]
MFPYDQQYEGGAAVSDSLDTPIASATALVETGSEDNAGPTNADPTNGDADHEGLDVLDVVGEDGGLEPAWRQRAIDRSTQAVRQRAAKRVQRFLNSAREIITEKASTEITVQEVVDRSGQSLRSFYQYFDGKHELLLALFEEEMFIAAGRLREASGEGDPLERLRAAVVMLYELCSPRNSSSQPLFSDFASRLMVDHPEEVSAAYAPVFECVASIVEAAGAAGLLRPGRPRRMANLVTQAATVTAGRTSAVGSQPITGDEVWSFCLRALVPDDIVAARGLG